ncbi:MAG: hypothetical protein ABJC26_15580 [Gemmatimonadaceae bacterium]
MKHRLTAVFTVVVLALTNSSCFGPRKIQLTAASEIPAAQSFAKVSSTDNGNTKIELSVLHLAMPGRVSPGATLYVVWVRGNQSDARSQNLGALKVSSDLSGTLTAVTPLKSFELFVTPESNQSIAEPSGKRMLYTSVTMK